MNILDLIFLHLRIRRALDPSPTLSKLPASLGTSIEKY